jgi:hypothetical protein
MIPSIKFDSRMTSTEGTEAVFVEAMHATLLDHGHESRESALLLSQLGEEPLLADKKPTNLKLRQCILKHPTKFVLHQEGNQALKIHALRPAAVGGAEATSVAADAPARGAHKVRGRAGSLASVSDRLEALVPKKKDDVASSESLRGPAVAESAVRDPQRAAAALPFKPPQATNVESKKSAVLTVHSSGKAPRSTAQSGCAAAAGGIDAGCARNPVVSTHSLNISFPRWELLHQREQPCKGALRGVRPSNASASPIAAAATAFTRAEFCDELPPPSTDAAAQHARPTSAIAQRQAAETERFKRCVDHLSQFQKANVNAHEVSPDQALQVFLHFAEVRLQHDK